MDKRTKRIKASFISGHKQKLPRNTQYLLTNGQEQTLKDPCWSDYWTQTGNYLAELVMGKVIGQTPCWEPLSVCRCFCVPSQNRKMTSFELVCIFF
ncbi:hypothetical protein P5673_015456 [Acropora cervicornis]|uniref:Uncharacterized protein n=1 Tax=Acropora cervicornis TaxID=6130 RepID=A0AAD9QIE4_ACRCE|nr:hypothetical protein P5673_015456 [Acropora cervicornis]